MHRLTRSIISLVTLAALAACTFGETEYSGPEFTAQMPKGWTSISPAEAGAPDARAAFLKRDAQGGNVVLTVASRTMTPAAAAGFVTAVLAEVTRQQGFVEEGREEVDVAGGKSTLVSYRATPPGASVPERFKQLALTHGNVGYVLTARLPAAPSEAIVEELTRIMTSFSPKDQPSVTPAASAIPT